MPNKCAFPWFIIAHSSCSQITSRRSNFRNKRAANAKAPCLQKTLHVRDVCIYSHATACTLHHLHVCVQICVYEIARNSSKAHDLWMSQATRLLHDMRLYFQIFMLINVKHSPQDSRKNNKKKKHTIEFSPTHPITSLIILTPEFVSFTRARHARKLWEKDAPGKKT